jgi:hypothetical protein
VQPVGFEKPLYAWISNGKCHLQASIDSLSGE